MRNIFDQYDQPENKLTHALFSSLCHDRSLVVPFLKWLQIDDIPHLSEIRIAQQTVPGISSDVSEGDAGLPDLSIYSDDGWGVFFEMKVQSRLTADQLRRHATTVKCYGFESPVLVAVCVEPIDDPMPEGTIVIQWRELYAWITPRMAASFWAAEFVRYMEVFEQKSVDDGYEIRGALTMFNGLSFDEDHPYHYREGKRLIRLLGDELQSHKDLQSVLDVDPKGDRRPAITKGEGVWDFIPLGVARGQEFTRFPHLTLALRPDRAIAAVTIPHGISGGFRTRVKELGSEGFISLMTEIAAGLQSTLATSPRARAVLYATQRHFKSQRSRPTVDGRIEADLLTCVRSNDGGVKFQPEWVESVFNLLVNKRSNIQCGIEVQFTYDCQKIRSTTAVDMFAESWLATAPLLSFALDREQS